MYRKRLQELQKMEDDKQVLTRVANYPMVKDTWSRVSEVYQRGKDGSRILRFCGGVAETSASIAYKASMPVIEKLPVGPVNDYAVQKLEVLEEKYPTLVKPTEQVVDELKSYSVTKLDDVKNYGTTQFNRIAEVARLHAVLNVADAVVDKLLPAVETEEEVESEDETAPPTTQEVVAEQPPVQASTRVRMLSDKLKRRAYDTAMSKAGAIQKRSQEAVGKLLYTVDLIDYAQQNIRSVKLEDAQEKVNSIYDEITREAGEEEEALPANANLEKKAIFVARAMTLRARSTFATVSRLSYALPAYARTGLAEAYQFADNMYQTFNKASSYGDFSRQMLSELRERMSFLEDVASNLTRYVTESAPLNWLASKESRAAVTNQPSADGNSSDSDSDPDVTDSTVLDDSVTDTMHSTANLEETD